MMVVQVGEAAIIALQLLSRLKSKPTRPYPPLRGILHSFG
jgi:hypothetical protein